MKLSPTPLRYLSPGALRLLTHIDSLSKSHKIVPTSLISSARNFVHDIRTLAKLKLVHHRSIPYDGYELAYGGADFLALNTFAKRKTVYSVGRQIGVGKESDINLVAQKIQDENGNEIEVQRILKLQRLGRISFRNVKNKRDYLGKKTTGSWMYLSKLGATKEFAFMKVLHQYGFPVPTPIDHNRHCIVMELIEGYPLYQIDEVADVAALYSELMELIMRFARHGLIHGDFNEFNLLIKTADDSAVVIDFPQMTSLDHFNGPELFARDVDCVRRFFRKRFSYESSRWPTWEKDIVPLIRSVALDQKVAASGFTKQNQKAMNEIQSKLEAEAAEIGSGGEEESDEEESGTEEDSESEEVNPDEPIVSTNESAESLELTGRMLQITT